MKQYFESEWSAHCSDMQVTGAIFDDIHNRSACTNAAASALERTHFSIAEQMFLHLFHSKYVCATITVQNESHHFIFTPIIMRFFGSIEPMIWQKFRGKKEQMHLKWTDTYACPYRNVLLLFSYFSVHSPVCAWSFGAGPNHLGVRLETNRSSNWYCEEKEKKIDTWKEKKNSRATFGFFILMKTKRIKNVLTLLHVLHIESQRVCSLFIHLVKNFVV